MKASEPLITVTLNGKTYDISDVVEVTWDEDEYSSYIQAKVFDVETENGNIYSVDFFDTEDSTWELLMDFIDCM